MKTPLFVLLLFTAVTCAAMQEKDIVIIIPSYNNSAYYIQNLDSVFTQQYSNYHVIYIDDCSPDGTGALVEQYLKNNKLEERCTLIKNDTRCGALANLYHAIHSCDNNAIIACLDGDDWFAHAQVLQTVNKAYANSDVWLTYGQYRTYPDGKLGRCTALPNKVIRSNSYRNYSWRTSALRTFYAWLFKKINLKDLQRDDQFFTMTWDQALMFPMLEMSGGRFKFISDVLYIYRINNPLNDHTVDPKLQQSLEPYLRKKPKYKALNAKDYNN